MSLLVLALLSANILVPNPYLNELSPLGTHEYDRDIIILINEEAKRLKIEDARRKHNDTLPSCPIQYNYWNCA